MIAKLLRTGLATLALTSLMAACGSSDQNTQPQNASTTTTTAYTAPILPPDTTTDPALLVPPANPAMTPSNAQTTGPATMSPQPAATLDMQVSAPAAMPLNDAQITATLEAANVSEIDQARIAAKKATNPRVREFAEQMITDHDQAESRLKLLESGQALDPQEGPASDQIKQDGEHVLLSLRSGASSSFDVTYLAAQIDEDRKALDMIDRSLVETQNASLKAHLQERRSKVADHLTEAKDIQASLAKM